MDKSTISDLIFIFLLSMMFYFLKQFNSKNNNLTYLVNNNKITKYEYKKLKNKLWLNFIIKNIFLIVILFFIIILVHQKYN